MAPEGDHPIGFKRRLWINHHQVSPNTFHRVSIRHIPAIGLFQRVLWGSGAKKVYLYPQEILHIETEPEKPQNEGPVDPVFFSGTNEWGIDAKHDEVKFRTFLKRQAEPNSDNIAWLSRLHLEITGISGYIVDNAHRLREYPLSALTFVAFNPNRKTFSLAWTDPEEIRTFFDSFKQTSTSIATRYRPLTTLINQAHSIINKPRKNHQLK